MTSAWYFKEPLRNGTKNFLISKLCFPWLAYTLTPSNFTQYFLISSNLPFNTETIEKFPAEKKLRRIYVCTPWLDIVHLVNSTTLTSEHKSSLYSKLWFEKLMAIVILWLLDTCDFYLDQLSMSRAHRRPTRRLTMGMSFHKKGECRSISAKPTSIKKDKDIPGSSEN